MPGASTLGGYRLICAPHREADFHWPCEHRSGGQSAASDGTEVAHDAACQAELFKDGRSLTYSARRCCAARYHALAGSPLCRFRVTCDCLPFGVELVLRSLAAAAHGAGCGLVALPSWLVSFSPFAVVLATEQEAHARLLASLPSCCTEGATPSWW